MEGDLRAIGRPCRADPFRGMLRQAEKSFASESLYIQVKALDPGCRITVPCEGDSGAIGRECRGSRLSGQSRKWNGSQSLLLLRTLRSMPSIGNYRGKGNDRNGESTSGDLQPLLTRPPASIRFNRDNWLCNRLFYRRYRRLQLTYESIPAARQRFDKARGLG